MSNTPQNQEEHDAQIDTHGIVHPEEVSGSVSTAEKKIASMLAGVHELLDGGFEDTAHHEPALEAMVDQVTELHEDVSDAAQAIDTAERSAAEEASVESKPDLEGNK